MSILKVIYLGNFRIFNEYLKLGNIYIIDVLIDN